MNRENLRKGSLKSIIDVLRGVYKDINEAAKKDTSIELLKVIEKESSLLRAPISLDIRSTCAFADEAYAKNVGGEDFPDEVVIFGKVSANRYKVQNFPNWRYEVPTSLPHPTVRLLCYLGLLSKEVCGEEFLVDPAKEIAQNGVFCHAFKASGITELPPV